MNDQPNSRLARNLGLYTLARIMLVAVIAGVVIGVGKAVSHPVQPLIALMLAVVVSLPLSMLLFKGLRGKVNAGIAVVDDKRRRDKAELRAKLRGEAPAAAAEPSSSREDSPTEDA